MHWESRQPACCGQANFKRCSTGGAGRMPALPVVSDTMRWYKPSLLYEESPNPGFYRASYDKAEAAARRLV